MKDWAGSSSAVCVNTTRACKPQQFSEVADAQLEVQCGSGVHQHHGQCSARGRALCSIYHFFRNSAKMFN